MSPFILLRCLFNHRPFRPAVLLATASLGIARLAGAPVQFVFTSDVHYGITRGNFRGNTNVDSSVVNAELVKRINLLPEAILPDDGGLNAQKPVTSVDFVVLTGDIANRMDLYPLPIQSASASWAQFERGFLTQLTLKDAKGDAAPLLLVPGNHDVTDAIGSVTKMKPLTDATSLAQIYNRMVHPTVLRTNDSYNYETDRVYYSRDFGGVHCVFLTLWPETKARDWLDADLKGVPATTSVFLFQHDPPEADPKHFTNPNGKHDMNPEDRFENILSDVYADGAGKDAGTVIEQRAFVAFLKRHKNVVAYFHGHSNWNEFYTWKGPDKDISLLCFRADSPMKGKVSGKDETKLSFQFIVYDVPSHRMTARECFLNSRNGDDAHPVSWGNSVTVSIAPRP